MRKLTAFCDAAALSNPIESFHHQVDANHHGIPDKWKLANTKFLESKKATKYLGHKWPEKSHKHNSIQIQIFTNDTILIQRHQSSINQSLYISRNTQYVLISHFPKRQNISHNYTCKPPCSPRWKFLFIKVKINHKKESRKKERGDNQPDLGNGLWQFYNYFQGYIISGETFQSSTQTQGCPKCPLPPLLSGP